MPAPAVNGTHTNGNAFLDPSKAKALLAEYEESDGLSLRSLMDSKVVSSNSYSKHRSMLNANDASLPPIHSKAG